MIIFFSARFRKLFLYLVFLRKVNFKIFILYKIVISNNSLIFIRDLLRLNSVNFLLSIFYLFLDKF